MLVVAYVIIVIVALVNANRRQRELDAMLIAWVESQIEISPDDFFELREENFSKKRDGEDMDVTGVYVLHNRTNGMYYVGQGTSVFTRVNAHFTGKGNGDVYADYKYGHDFAIRILPLNGSAYNTLNALEREMIQAYDACESGYNKNKGNS